MCREAGKGDGPCVTIDSPCNICENFTEKQQIKIKHRRRYVRKQNVSDPCNRYLGNLGQWEKVALFPCSDFIAENQLVRESYQSVSLVTIPALSTIVDRQFKEDRTLCLVQAIKYYFNRTKDLRESRSLLLISFKKGYTSDIRPATPFFLG